jgi:phosphatidate cytidylyltransferase
MEPGSTSGDADAAGEDRRVVGGRDLPVAIGVGLALAALFLGTLFWHPAAFTVVVAALTAVAYVEANRVLREVGHRLEVPVLVVATLVMLFGAYQARHAGQAVGVAVLLVGGVVWLLADPGRRDVVRRLADTTLFGLWVGFLASFAVLLVSRPTNGAIAVLAVIGAATLTDIGGYAFGVPFGRHKVAPNISPSKSWEGLAGGLVVAVAGGAGILPLLDPSFTPATGAVLAVACGLAAFAGDLMESMLKRELGVKDLGSVLPGHGGILDRVDGILFALPVGFYAVELLVV